MIFFTKNQRGHAPLLITNDLPDNIKKINNKYYFIRNNTLTELKTESYSFDTFFNLESIDD